MDGMKMFLNVNTAFSRGLNRAGSLIETRPITPPNHTFSEVCSQTHSCPQAGQGYNAPKPFITNMATKKAGARQANWRNPWWKLRIPPEILAAPFQSGRCFIIDQPVCNRYELDKSIGSFSETFRPHLQNFLAGNCKKSKMKSGKAALMKMLIGSLLTKTMRQDFAIIAGVILVSASSLCAGPVQLISARNPSLALLPGGNGDSVAPWISDDGRYLVFSSLANDLAPGGNSQQVLNVYLYDRSFNSTELVSANASGTGGGNGHSTAGQVSADGRYVVFQSDASDLVPGDTNGVSDIFLRDTFTGITVLISVAANGGCANGASTDPVMTPDGTCVAFISSATNLVAGDTNGIPDVFVRDLITQTTWLMSVGATGANGSMATPVITPDGRFVAFFSTATNLVAGVPGMSTGEVYVRDRLARTTIWASVNAALTCSNILQTSPGSSWSLMPSTHPVISDDGRYVAFKTGWTNGITQPPAGTPAVIFFQYDSVNRTTTIVSTNGYPPWANCDDVYGPEMTPDGRFIAFVQCDTIYGWTNSSVRLWDRLTGTNVLVSPDANSGLPPGFAVSTISHTPAVSHDGRYVTYLSYVCPYYIASTNLHIYRRDMQTTTNVLVDANTNGVGSGDQLGTIPVLSADGQSVAFSALDGGLIVGDNNNAPDVFLWDAATGTNMLISAHDPSAVFQSGNLSEFVWAAFHQRQRWIGGLCQFR